MEKKLTRIPSEAVAGGVAAGMADYFGIDRSIVRVLWVVALLLPIPPTFFWTAIIYIIFWVALPESIPGANAATIYDPNAPAGSPEASRQTFFSNSSDPDRSIKIIGVVLLAVGGILLLDELPYWYRIREYIWPVGLIVAGAYLLLRLRDRNEGTSKDFTNTDFTSPPTPPPADPFAPRDPFPPVEPDPTPYRPFDRTPSNPDITPDRPTDPDGNTNLGGEPPITK